MRIARILPVLLFLASAGGAVALGVRIVDAERASAEAAAREGLRVALKEAESALREQAARLQGEVASGTVDAVLSPDGAILSPPPPAPLERLPAPRDPEAAFFLAEGERAEAAEGDPERALGFYRSAAGSATDPAARPQALYRAALLHRRIGGDRAANSLEEEFLASLPEGARGCLEELLVRARRSPPDPELPGLLAGHLGADPETDAVIVGIGRMAGIGPDVFRRRREELALRSGLGEFAKSPPLGRRGISFLPKDGPSTVIGAWARMAAWERSADGTLRLRIEDAADLPDPVFTLEGENRLQHLVGNLVTLGPRAGDGPRETLEPAIPGWTPDAGLPVHLAAAASSAAVADDARRSAWMLGGLLAALLLAGASAFLLSLRAARREAEAARARADFVTRVGHDLRTPLAVIRMYAETLAAGRVADPAEARSFAAVAAREAERLTGMVEQVLDISRASRAVPTERRAADLASLAEEVAAWHRPLLERAGLRLEVRAAGPLPVLADGAALRGAVSNLLENAARHAASGGSVAVEAAGEGTMAVVRVLDRGPGLPPPGHRLFERFVRGPGAGGSGAGLGLALVREAAEAHGGSADAADRDGGGAVFALRIPLRKEGS